MLFRVFTSFPLLLLLTDWAHCASSLDLQKDGVCPPVLDIIILFDTSGGNDTVYQQQKNWTIEIVRELPIHEDAVRVGLILYSMEARTEFNLSKYSERNDLIKNFDSLEFLQGDTKTGIALNKADEEIFNYAGGARLKANRLIIVFTDGLSMDNPTKAAKTLRRKGVKIFTISVNSIGFVPEMLGIVGDADHVFGPMDEERLKERLLSEVEHSRSCDVQPKRHEKTTSAFAAKTTERFPFSASTGVTTSLVTSTPARENVTHTLILPDSNSSEESRFSNSIEDIGMDESNVRNSSSTSLLVNVTSSPAWSKPIQLFTVEHAPVSEAKHLNNLTTLLEEEEPVVHARNTTEGSLAETELTKSIATLHPTSPETTVTTISTPTMTTICINQPVVTSTVAPSTRSSTESFITKIGSKKEKNAISKFLGRDIPNINLPKGGESSDFGAKQSGTLSNTSENDEFNTSGLSAANNSNTDSSQKSISSTTKSSFSKFTNRLAFTTRVTFRPFKVTARTISTTAQTSTTTSPTTAPTTSQATSSTSTSTSTTTSTPLTTSTLNSVTTQTPTSPATTSTTTTTTIIPPTTRALTPTRRFTPTRSQSSLLNTLASVTAFPTLLSMEKAVTLPINKKLESAPGAKPMKKKIRRIIKRRRNILPSSQAKKVTDKILEVKHIPVPTPTTPPVRTILTTDVVEEKEEIASSGVQCPMDILFVVDSSGSIARTYDTQKDFLTVLIKKVEPSRSHRVGLIQFAGPHIQKMEWSFDTHSKNSQLLSAIRSVRHLTGTTYIGAALELSLILLDSRRKHTETTVILISDGFSQDDSTQQAKLLRQLPNVKMYAISLNKLTNTRYLLDIVGDRKNLFVNDESKWFEEFFTKKLRCIPTRR